MNDMFNTPESIAQDQSREQEDSNRYETDTHMAIEKLYHSWLGEVPNEHGVYVRDDNLKKTMNQLCASMLRQEILSRFFDNMNFSELDLAEIEEIASYASEHCAERLQDYFVEYEMQVSDIVPVSEQIYSFLKIGLSIAKNGGMKSYKVQRGQINVIKREDQTQG